MSEETLILANQLAQLTQRHIELENRFIVLSELLFAPVNGKKPLVDENMYNLLYESVHKKLEEVTNGKPN